MSIAWIVGIVIVLALVYIVMTYNRLIAKIEAVKNSQQQIDVQLDRRYKVFESLINVVKNYMDYEKTTLKDVIALRSQAKAAQESGDDVGRIKAEEGISRIAGSLNLQFEAYPELKANQNVLQLQEEITSTENKLAYAKQAYNDSIERFNADKNSFFVSMVAGLFKKLNQNFVYWNLGSIEKREQMENYSVKL